MNHSQEQPVFAVRIETDTTYPYDLVPIYLIHTLEKPFCPRPGCWCHTDPKRIAVLLEHVRNGIMTLHEAANFADGRTV